MAYYAVIKDGVFKEILWNGKKVPLQNFEWKNLTT